ncbi:MAG: rubredoxin-like domain-containing protein [Sphaerochaetaceae bacterium]|jgi:rubrerythrin
MEKVEHSPKAMSAIYSNAAKAAEKQMRFEEATLFSDLSAHFDGKSEKKSATSIDEVKPFITEDLTSLYKEAEALALKEGERGVLRCTTWGKKVTAIHKSLLDRYEKQGDALLEGNNVYVCEACGFINVSPAVPQICPICKAPASRFLQIK